MSCICAHRVNEPMKERATLISGLDGCDSASLLTPRAKLASLCATPFETTTPLSMEPLPVAGVWWPVLAPAVTADVRDAPVSMGRSALWAGLLAAPPALVAATAARRTAEAAAAKLPP